MPFLNQKCPQAYRMKTNDVMPALFFAGIRNMPCAFSSECTRTIIARFVELICAIHPPLTLK